MISIELKDDVVYQFGESEIKKIPDHLPFGNKFTIEFPVHVFLTKRQVIEDIRKEGGNTDPIMINRFVEDYVNSNLELETVIDENKNKIVTLWNPEPFRKEVFKFVQPDIIPMARVLINEITPDENKLLFAFRLYKIITNTLQYVNKPVVKKTKRTTKKKRKYNNTNKGKRRSNSPTYIKKTLYTISSVEDNDRVISKHDYNRVKDSWLVRGHYREGHWRTYTDAEGNKKKTYVKGSWVKPHVRGDGDDNPNQKYKITDTN